MWRERLVALLFQEKGGAYWSERCRHQSWPSLTRDATEKGGVSRFAPIAASHYRGLPLLTNKILRRSRQAGQGQRERETRVTHSLPDRPAVRTWEGRVPGTGLRGDRRLHREDPVGGDRRSRTESSCRPRTEKTDRTEPGKDSCFVFLQDTASQVFTVSQPRGDETTRLHKLTLTSR